MFRRPQLIPFLTTREALIFSKTTRPHEQVCFLIEYTMKKNPEVEEPHHHQDLEILKAVAQAWYSHSGSSRPISEFDAHRRNFKDKPSRFHLQAMTKSSTMEDLSLATTWDFNQSLWDSYELVTVSRMLETGLTLYNDDPFSNLSGSRIRRRRRQESKNSLRNLFNQMSSRRFNVNEVPRESNT